MVMDIKKLIGETTEYDKKADLEIKKPKSWLKSVSAFANTEGGKLIFGVDKFDNPIGVDDSQYIAEKMSEQINARITPLPETTLDIVEMDGKKFVVLDVRSGAETPYYYSGDGVLTAYIRVGNESVPVDALDLKRLVLKGSNKSFDSLSSEYRVSDYSFTVLHATYLARAKKDIDESDFVSFGLADENGMLTNAGALLADQGPIRYSRVFCTRWNGLNMTDGTMDSEDSQEYSGSLITLLEDSKRFVNVNTKTRWKKLNHGRVEFPDYPERAIEEAIVNGLIHRDYLDYGSELHVDIFDDRIEFYSPGGMFDGSLVQNLDTDNVPSKRRNPIIADLFDRMNFAERRGSGFKKINNSYRDQVLYSEERSPKYFSDRNTFRITLYNLNYEISMEEASEIALGTFEKSGDKPQKVAIKSGDKISNITKKQKEAVLLYMSDGEEHTTKEAMNLLNVKVSRARLILKMLLDDKKIEAVGANRNRKYVLKK